MGDSMEWNWTLVHPLEDVNDIIALAEYLWVKEGLQVLKKDTNRFRHMLTVSATNQLFDKSKEFLAVARTKDKAVLGYCWFDRYGYTPYSVEEVSNAKFHHVDLDLPVRTRVKLINEMIDQHILWCNQYGIPVICSTSIRAENDGFMKIHKRRGFEVNGSYGWIRTEEGMKCLGQ